MHEVRCHSLQACKLAGKCRCISSWFCMLEGCAAAVVPEGGNHDFGGQILRPEGRLESQPVGGVDLYSLCHLSPANFIV
jgi:hypothetical protein